MEKEKKTSSIFGVLSAFSLQTSYTRKRKRKESTLGIVGEIPSNQITEFESQFIYGNHIQKDIKVEGKGDRKIGISISESTEKPGGQHFRNVIVLPNQKNICTHSCRNQSKYISTKKKNRLPFSKMSAWSKLSISLAIYYLSSSFYNKEYSVVEDSILTCHSQINRCENKQNNIFKKDSNTSNNFFLFANAQEILFNSPELASKSGKEIPLVEGEEKDREMKLEKTSHVNFEDPNLNTIFKEIETLHENEMKIDETIEEEEEIDNSEILAESISPEKDVVEIVENSEKEEKINTEEPNLVKITTENMHKEENTEIASESFEVKDNLPQEDIEISAIISMEEKEDVDKGRELDDSNFITAAKDEELQQPEEPGNSLFKSIGNIFHEGQGILSKVANDFELELEKVAESFKPTKEVQEPIDGDHIETSKETKEEGNVDLSSEKENDRIPTVDLEQQETKNSDNIQVPEKTTKMTQVMEESLAQEIVEKSLLEDSLLLDMDDFFVNGLHNHNTLNPNYGIHEPANSHLKANRYSDMYDGKSIIPKHLLPPLLHEGFHVDIDEISISSGDQHVCAIQYRPGIDYGGFAKCWGHNIHGQAKPPPGRFMQISSGHFSTCGITEFQTVVCWGLLQPNPSGRFIQISVGDWHGCGILEDGSIRCWGRNDQLQASPPSPYYFTKEHNDGIHPGRPRSGGFRQYKHKSQDSSINENNSSPKLIHKISNKREEFVQVSCGKEISCGLTKRGLIHCWGKTMANPPPNYSFGPFKQISCGSFDKCCSLSLNGTAVCWGEDGLDIQPGPFIQISASHEHTCGITEHNQVQCWGSVLDQLAPKADLIEVEITDPEEYQEAIAVERKLKGEALEGQPIYKKAYKNKWFEISVGSHHACAVNDDSELHCWSPTTALWGTRGLSSAEDFVVA